MGLFGEKKICPICGNPAGGLLAAKIKDRVPLCSECTKKILTVNNPRLKSEAW